MTLSPSSHQLPIPISFRLRRPHWSGSAEDRWPLVGIGLTRHAPNSGLLTLTLPYFTSWSMAIRYDDLWSGKGVPPGGSAPRTQSP